MLAPSAAERGAQPPVCQAPGGAENRARQQLTGCGHAPNMTTDHLISRVIFANFYPNSPFSTTFTFGIPIRGKQDLLSGKPGQGTNQG